MPRRPKETPRGRLNTTVLQSTLDLLTELTKRTGWERGQLLDQAVKEFAKHHQDTADPSLAA